MGYVAIIPMYVAITSATVFLFLGDVELSFVGGRTYPVSYVMYSMTFGNNNNVI